MYPQLKRKTHLRKYWGNLTQLGKYVSPIQKKTHFRKYWGNIEGTQLGNSEIRKILKKHNWRKMNPKFRRKNTIGEILGKFNTIGEILKKYNWGKVKLGKIPNQKKNTISPIIK
jgi:hypothetical protein